ncbi:hypothetical protein [Caulobacter hibisci]|uniref:Uncharacterized protein n=1 Tax=Caulobacter hibisci TaxID=2035993 RepID=A0ABS0SVH2_9CAUL|nr:hypothetical protein [Caulobacter hibisci]MBI1682678.1 hypothetical protein [Caulobacter hibisci]
MRLALCIVVLLATAGPALAQPRDPPTFWASGAGRSAACFQMADGRVRVPADNHVRVADYSMVGETLQLENLRDEGWQSWHPDLYGTPRQRAAREREAARMERALDEAWYLLRGLPKVEKRDASRLVLRSRDGRRASFVAVRVCRALEG